MTSPNPRLLCVRHVINSRKARFCLAVKSRQLQARPPLPRGACSRLAQAAVSERIYLNAELVLSENELE
jgi:hypothetical protein